MTDTRPSTDRRTAMTALGVTGAIRLAGCVGDLGGAQDGDATSDAEQDEDQYFKNNPQTEILVIDAYHEVEKVWFIHTSALDAEMAEMINYLTLHVPKLNDIVTYDEMPNIYV